MFVNLVVMRNIKNKWSGEMKTIKQLEKEIDNKDEGCKAKKIYTTEGGAVRFYTCGRMKKCPNCEDYLIELQAQLSYAKAIKKMIEELPMKMEGLEKSDFSWEDLKGEIIRSFSECKTEKDLLRELERIVRNSGMKKEILSKIEGEEK